MYDMGPLALLPFQSKLCYGFSLPSALGPMASTLPLDHWGRHVNNVEISVLYYVWPKKSLKGGMWTDLWNVGLTYCKHLICKESIFLQTYKNLCSHNSYEEIEIKQQWRYNENRETKLSLNKIKHGKALGEDKVRPIYILKRNITETWNW
jgi:hypothetical protein